VSDKLPPETTRGYRKHAESEIAAGTTRLLAAIPQAGDTGDGGALRDMDGLATLGLQYPNARMLRRGVALESWPPSGLCRNVRGLRVRPGTPD